MAVVQVDHEAIKNLGGKFHGFETEVLGPALASLNNLTVSPGAFADADALKNVVIDKRVVELKAALENLKKTMKEIGDRLVNLAKKYESTEADNTITADDTELTELIKLLKGYLPGIRL